MDDGEIRGRKRRANRAVLGGLCLMVAAMLISSAGLAPRPASTAAAVVGFVLLAYGVHVGWLVFYDRESDGPPA